jgi:membrane-bound lytic murein transglycosylase F
MRKPNIRENWPRWTKLTIAVSAAALLSSYKPLPTLVEQIKTLGELRVATRNDPLVFYRGPDEIPQGPEYELAQRFADELGVRLKIIPMRTYGEIYQAITSGRAHLAAAGLKVPGERIPGIEFGPAYQTVREHLIYRRGGAHPNSLADIGNADLEIAAGSSQALALRAARNRSPALVWVENASTDSQALLDGVAEGSIDYTIADSSEFALAHDAHPDLRIAFDLPGEQSIAWAASVRDPSFVRDVSGYFDRLRATGQLAAIVQRFYGRSDDLESAGERTFMGHLQSRLPLYRKWFEEAAQQSDQDWRLLAAMGYQESKWDPSASSGSGAIGLMQLTAHVAEPDRTWFALAAYNIGYGHLEDARVLAQKAGRDPDSWQDVREFLPLLEQERWYGKTQNGYARGSEPVRYVDNVRGYRDLLEWAWGADSNSASLN